jgi:short-subunit dehydrogenase
MAAVTHNLGTTWARSCAMANRIDPARFGGAALITGASSGIGLAFAEALALRGLDLVLVARRGEILERIAERLSRANQVEVLSLPVDLTSEHAIEQIMSAIDRAQIPIGVLINNAGVGRFGPFTALDRRAAESMVELNCRVPVTLTHALLPQMLSRGRGALIFVSSIAGFQPTPQYAVYGASKGFNLLLGESLWAELRPYGIDVLTLCPGYTPTEFQQVAGSHRARRVGPSTTAEEVVDSALRGLGRRPTVVPGAINKLMTLAPRLFPRGMVARVVARLTAPNRGL